MIVNAAYIFKTSVYFRGKHFTDSIPEEQTKLSLKNLGENKDYILYHIRNLKQVCVQ